MPKLKSDEERRTYAKAVVRSSLAQALSLGMNFAAGMAFFTFIGYWIDRKRGGGLAFTVGGMFMGLLYGAYEAWKGVRLLNMVADAQPRPEANRSPHGTPNAEDRNAKPS